MVKLVVINAENKLHNNIIYPTVNPVAQLQQSQSVRYSKKVDDELTSLERKGITEKLNGPTPRVSPLVLTPKRNGNVQICVDMRMANQAIKTVNDTTSSIFVQGIIS